MTARAIGFAATLFFMLSSTVFAETKSWRITALGDSTTAGTPGFASPLEAPSKGHGNPKSQYTYWIKQKHPEWEIFNRGINGERSDQILARTAAHIRDDGADIVIVLAGVNDLYQGHSAASVKSRLEEIYKTAEGAGARVMACTILPYNISTPQVRLRMRRVNEWIRDHARKNGLGFCDTYAALRHPERPGHLISSEDQIHPDEAAYRLMGEVVGTALERWLR